jgi:hypothetical protein
MMKTMKLSEFLAREGAAEGKSGGEVLNDIHAGLEAANREESEALKDPKKALEFIQAVQNLLWDDEYDQDARRVVSVVRVLESQCDNGIRGAATVLKARVICKSGRTHTVLVKEWSTSGSYYEPPEGESDIQFLN